MKAIVIDKPYEVEIRDVPMPHVGEGEALLRVLYVGICGADVLNNRLDLAMSYADADLTFA